MNKTESIRVAKQLKLNVVLFESYFKDDDFKDNPFKYFVKNYYLSTTSEESSYYYMMLS
jgi:hypothetical protein